MLTNTSCWKVKVQLQIIVSASVRQIDGCMATVSKTFHKEMVHHNHKYKYSCPSTTLTCSLLIYRVFEKNVSKMIAALLQKDLYLNINT